MRRPLLACALACALTASCTPQPPSATTAGESPVGADARRGDPVVKGPASLGPAVGAASAQGYRPVDLGLTRLHHEGGVWHLGASPLEGATAEEREQAVVLEAKMVLDDSRPRRRTFWAAPHYDGCVDRHARRHAVHWVRVMLPPGESVQVTDHRLFIQGVLGAPGEDGRLRFNAVSVQRQGAAVDRGGPHR